MKQIVQNYKTGEIQLIETSPPVVRSGCVLVKNLYSLVSVGTEKYMIDLAKKSLLGKAIARPDWVKQVIAKIQTEGLIETYKAAMARLDTPVPLGYSSSGVVIEVGGDVEEFKIGDLVACTGSGYASHAEIVCVPNNLCVKIPHMDGESIDLESASFGALGGIALEAVRLAKPEMGDRIAVIGLGLLGQICVQLLKSNGVYVFGVDISEEKLKLAFEHGLDAGCISGKADVVREALNFASKGFDAVILMAATKSNEPLEIGAEIARERGRIVAVGSVGLNIPRKQFFEKELEFVVSRAWGPGVFDPHYIDKNSDYPYGYVRWTAQRNVEEFLFKMAEGKINVKNLITHRFKIDEALKAYEMILKGKGSYLGVIINYPDSKYSKTLLKREKIFIKKISPKKATREVVVGFIGAGLFAQGTILPLLKKMGSVRLKGLATATGFKGGHAAKKFGFEYFTTDYKEVLDDEEINLIFVMTRHNSHTDFVIEALKRGKNVFVEKPLSINNDQLTKIKDYIETNGLRNILMVGFNRRFSPFTEWIKNKFAIINEPKSIHITVNAGFVPFEHWSQDREIGGGRIIGEVCHFIDLIQYLTDSYPRSVYAINIESQAYKPWDNVNILLKMEDGSIASILYIASGDKRYMRERVEIFAGGAVGIIENFKKAIFVYKGKTQKRSSMLEIDRGHKKELEILVSAVKNGEIPVEFEEYYFTTKTTFDIQESLKINKPVDVL